MQKGTWGRKAIALKSLADISARPLGARCSVQVLLSVEEMVSVKNLEDTDLHLCPRPHPSCVFLSMCRYPGVTLSFTISTTYQESCK